MGKVSDLVATLRDDDWLKSRGRPAQHRSYAILRVKKLKTKGNLGAALGHNFRERDTPNADLSRLHQNTILKGQDHAQGVMADWDARAPEKIRKNAVHALEYFVGGSPEKVRAMGRNEQDAYFRKALDWLEKRHGAENVLSAVVHRDETTPHLQALVIPLDQRGKLNARELVGGKDTLRQMQTDFARDVGQEFGLKRGLEGSKATHQTLQEHYGRIRNPVDPDFSLPERHKGAFLGVGKETDEEWRRRADNAAFQHLKAVVSPVLDENTALHQRAAQLEGGLEKAKADLETLKRVNKFSLEVERTLGREWVEAVERGEAVHVPGETAKDSYTFAVEYLEHRQTVGEDHTQAIHRLHGQDVMREHRERELAREKDSGLEWG